MHAAAAAATVEHVAAASAAMVGTDDAAGAAANAAADAAAYAAVNDAVGGGANAAALNIAERAANFYLSYFATPGVALDRSQPFMDRVTGEITYPIMGADFDPFLLFFAAATRLGGLLPDELPFNLVQKAVRATLRPFGIGFFDLQEGDERRQWQDKWYGTTQTIKLPFGMNEVKPVAEEIDRKDDEGDAPQTAPTRSEDEQVPVQQGRETPSDSNTHTS